MNRSDRLFRFLCWMCFPNSFLFSFGCVHKTRQWKKKSTLQASYIVYFVSLGTALAFNVFRARGRKVGIKRLHLIWMRSWCLQSNEFFSPLFNHESWQRRCFWDINIKITIVTIVGQIRKQAVVLCLYVLLILKKKTHENFSTSKERKTFGLKKWYLWMDDKKTDINQ